MGRHTTKLGEHSRAQARPPLPYPVDDGRVAPPVREAMERRTQRRRSRLAALSAASMLAVGGAAGMSMAMADEPEAVEDGQIVFSGDCGTLDLISPTSRPSTEELTVAEGSQVGYVNELDASATLHVGSETYEVAPGSTQTFVMNRSAEVAMVPDCRGVFADYDSARVTVVAAPADDDEADEADESDPDSVQLPSQGSDSATGSGSTGGDSAGEAAPEERPAPGDDASDAGAGVRGGEPAGADETEAPEATEEPTESEGEVNSFGESGAGSDGSELAPAADEVAAVDPKAVTDGASGLLALVAIVCLVGVSAAVMRTMLKQRTAA